MTELDDSEQIKDLADKVWQITVQYCQKVLNHAQVYGFNLMEIPDPDVHKLYDALETVILPILEKLVGNPHLDDMDSMKMINVGQYIRHVRGIVKSIQDDSRPEFEQAVSRLDAESFLPMSGM